MRRLFLSLILAASCMMVAAQNAETGTLHRGGHSKVYNLRDPETFIKLSEVMSNNAKARAGERQASGYRWIDRIYNAPAYLKTFYNTYEAAIKDVLNGNKNWTVDPTLGTFYQYNGEYGAPVTKLSGSTTFIEDTSQDLFDQLWAKVDEASADQWNECANFFSYLFFAMAYDIPEAFWMSNSYSIQYEVNCTYSTRGNSVTVNYELSIYYTLKGQNYDVRWDIYQDPETIMNDVSVFNNAVNTGVATADGKTDRYDILLAYNNWLTSRNYYNPYLGSNQATNFAYSPMSSLTAKTGKDAPVCEGYARAFKALCDKKGIPCVLSIGNATVSRTDKGESHMWNEVQMEDGNWYAVDVTWNDPVVDGTPKALSGCENLDWFLLGGKDIVSADGLTFNESHPRSIPAIIEADVISKWDFDGNTLIADHKYDKNSSGGSDNPGTDPDPDEPGTDPEPTEVITIADITALIEKYLNQ